MWKRQWTSSKGEAGTFDILAGFAADVSKIASAVDDMFRNSPQPTKTESEKAFGLSFVKMLGNVKAFILSICLAVVFTTLLVSANTMAMSIRERTREVAVLKTLGFERQTILGLFVGEAVSLSLVGGRAGCVVAWLLVFMAKHSPQMGLLLGGVKVTPSTLGVALLAAGLVGLLSSRDPFLPRLAGGNCGWAAAHRLKFMTLGSFVVRNTFRNTRRSILTMLSIGFSLLLLTLMISIWRTFYIDQVAPEVAKRVITRDRVSLSFLLPAYYRDKIRAVPGVIAVVPMTWFGGRYKDDRPEELLRAAGHRPGRIPESSL